MKRFVLMIFILFTLILTGCGGEEVAAEPQVSTATEEIPSISDNTGETGEQPAPQTDGQVQMMNREVSDLTKLLVGLFKLEDTDLTLTSEQASSLTTILNTYLELSQNQNFNSEPQAGGSAQSSDDMQTQQAEQQTQQEDLIAQIEAVLTADQLNSVSSLELDQDSLSTFLEEQGISVDGQPDRNFDQPMPQGTPSTDQSGDIPQVQGTPGEGGSNGGPGGNQQGDGTTPDAQFTPGTGQGGGQPEQEGGFGGFGGSGSTSRLLIEALLQLLESKINS